MGLVVESRFHPKPKENEGRRRESNGFTKDLSAAKQLIGFAI